MPRECILSEFEILVGQLKHNKLFSQEKLGRCNAKLYELSHIFKKIKATNADFNMLK